MNPFEVIKTQLMVRNHHLSLTHTIRSLFQQHGPFVLFRGVHLGVLSASATNSFYFVLYENLKDWAVTHIGRFGYGITALFSRAAAVTLMLPVEILRTRAYVQAEKGSLWGFHGLQAQVWRDLIWSTLFWQLFEEGSRWTQSLGFSETFSYMVPSSIAAVTASLLTHPLDVLKTRLQLHFDYAEFPLKGLWDLYKSSGGRMLFKGVTVRCTRSLLSLPLFIYVYMKCRAYLVSKASVQL